MKKQLLCLMAFLTLLVTASRAFAQDDIAAALGQPMEVIFALDEADIESWEESGEGKYIYINMTKEKGAELESFTTQYVGHALVIAYQSANLYTGVIKGPIQNQGSFVLVPAEDERDLLLGLMDPEKQKSAAVKDLQVSGELEGSPEAAAMPDAEALLEGPAE